MERGHVKRERPQIIHQNLGNGVLEIGSAYNSMMSNSLKKIITKGRTRELG